MKKLPFYKLNIKCLFIIHFIFCTHTTVAQDYYKSLEVPDGFHIELFTSDILAPRQMAEGKNFIFVGGIKGQIFAVSKINPKQKILLASELNNSRGVALKNGDLYFTEVDKIWVIRGIEKFLDSDPDKTLNYELFNDDLPSDAWHGGKWIKFSSDGNLYTNVGAPCNICDDGFTKDSRYASIIKLQDKSWKTVARGVRNSIGFDWHPQTDKLYFGDNGRDWLGDDSPSCELNILEEEDSFFGFPFLHATNIIDPKFGDGIKELNEEIVLPVLEIGAHVPYIPAAKFYTKYFEYDIPGGSDFEGLEYSSKIGIPNTGLDFEVGFKDYGNNGYEDQWFFNLTFNINKMNSNTLINDQAFERTSMIDKKYEKVRRENIIIKSKAFSVKAGGL